MKLYCALCGAIITRRLITHIRYMHPAVYLKHLRYQPTKGEK